MPMLVKPRFKPGTEQQVLREAPAPVIDTSGMTPEQVARQRKIAEQLSAMGSDYSPVQHWTQGLARVANAFVGNLEESRATEAEKAGRKSRDEALSAFFADDANADPKTRVARSLALAQHPWLDEMSRGMIMQRAMPEPVKPTDDMREYEWAKEGGFQGSPMDYMTKLRQSGVTPLPLTIPGTGFSVDATGNIVPGAAGPGAPPAPVQSAPLSPPDQPMPPMQAQPMPQVTPPQMLAPAAPPTLVPLTGEALKRANLGNAPAGKQWGIDRATGKIGQMRVEGTQGEIPGEIAARIGLSTSFFKDADFVVSQIEKGATTDIGGQADLLLGRGEAGQVWRLVSDGSDAMQRLLTGAGMPAAEAANYTARFIPAFLDKKSTQIDKVRNLTRRLKEVVEVAGRGRLEPDDIKRILGVTEVGDTGPVAPAAKQTRVPNKAAIDDLRSDPGGAAEFDEWYGPGSAEKVLGGSAGGPLNTVPVDPDPYQIEDLRKRREEMNKRHKRMLTRP